MPRERGGEDFSSPPFFYAIISNNMEDYNGVGTSISIKRQCLTDIEKSWDRFQELQAQAKDARGEFIEAIMEATRHKISQAIIAKHCKTEDSHLSRGRISQFIMEARK